MSDPIKAEPLPNTRSSTAVPLTKPKRFDRTMWLVGYISKPILFFLAGVAVLACLGLAQSQGWITSVSGESVVPTTQASSQEYICPMMCVPPLQQAGRCPVCAMELVPADAGGTKSDGRSIVVDPASRRIANIATVSARSIPLTRTIRAVGELQYDEGTLRTIAAYSAGRFERLYVDYTGAKVKKGDVLASFYSPDLYSAQVEFLLARRPAGRVGSTSQRIVKSSERMAVNSRRRLIELGMSPDQIVQLEGKGEADSRLDIPAPMSGTVIDKLISEGDYVKEGQAVLRLADLSAVWLMLELFPEDAAVVGYGQRVEATVESLPSQTLTGRVAFVDPDVDPVSRTVSVRVVIPNTAGELRIGEFAAANIEVAVQQESAIKRVVYDTELANKWISPHHPHVVADQPGECRICGRPLVHASALGITDQSSARQDVIVVPRDAVLMAAGHSVLYVETTPGRFEIRRVLIGATSGDNVVIVKGLADGESVATRGNFLLDSQMQLAGNPSLIDPTRAAPPERFVPGFTVEMLTVIETLPPEQATKAKEQGFCPITESRLGSMGVPIPVTVDNRTVYICCDGCRETLLKKPQQYLQRLAELQSAKATGKTSTNDAEMDLPPIGEIELLPAQGDTK